MSLGKAIADAEKNASANWIKQLDVACQYYLKKDVSALSDAEWAETIGHLLWLRKDESKHQNNINY